jgi:hypothetical protein
MIGPMIVPKNLVSFGGGVANNFQSVYTISYIPRLFSSLIETSCHYFKSEYFGTRSHYFRCKFFI